MNEVKKTFQFEETLKRLETIVESLEGESQSLEKSLALFEEGIKLTRQLKQYLEEAEQKVQILLKDAEGKLKTEDLTG